MAREYMCAFHSMLRETKRLTDSQFGQLMRALIEYSETGIEPTNLTALPERVQAAYDIYAGQIDRDNESYARKCQQNRENVGKRWQQKHTDEYDGIRTYTNVYETYQEEEKGDREEECTSSIEEDKPKRKRFVPPTLDEVRDYINEQGYRIDAEAFIDHYQSVGWKVGQKPMKDWKAAVRTWVRRDKEKMPNKGESSFNEDDFMIAALKRTYGAGVGA